VAARRPRAHWASSISGTEHGVVENPELVAPPRERCTRFGEPTHTHTLEVSDGVSELHVAAGGVARSFRGIVHFTGQDVDQGELDPGCDVRTDTEQRARLWP